MESLRGQEGLQVERGERAHVPRGEGAGGEGIGPKRQQERSADGEC